MRDRLSILISLFERYQSFSVSNYAVAASSFLASAKNEKDTAVRKIFVVRIFSEMMQSCENVARLVRVLHDRSMDPFENLLSKDSDAKYFDPVTLEKELATIKTYKDDPKKLFDEYFKIDVFWDLRSVQDKRAFFEVVEGIIAAFENMLSSPKGVNRVLWKAYNKLKHGAPVLNKEAKEVVVIYIDPKTPIEFPATMSDAETWMSTTEALHTTMSSLVNLTLHTLKYSLAIIDALYPPGTFMTPGVNNQSE